MNLYCNSDLYRLYQGSMLDMLAVIDENSIDAIITDPPYELNFMNKGWDNTGIAFQVATWEKCFRVLKPGGYLLSFGGTRTFHRIACAIEDAGFEIRDQILWIYGSGFPKSMSLGKSVESKLTTGSANKTEFKTLEGSKVPSGDWGIAKNTAEYGARPSDYSADGHLRTVDVEYRTEEGKQWDGWGSALKPAYEPVIVARKPCDGSLTDNVLRWGVGGLNIDECRIGDDVRSYRGAGSSPSKIDNHAPGDTGIGMLDGRGSDIEYTVSGRFPANVILTYDDSDYDEVCGGFPDSRGASSQNNYSNGHIYRGQSLQESNTSLSGYREWYNDFGSASRYFYCAKASKKDREEGLFVLKNTVFESVADIPQEIQDNIKRLLSL